MPVITLSLHAMSPKTSGLVDPTHPPLDVQQSFICAAFSPIVPASEFYVNTLLKMTNMSHETDSCKVCLESIRQTSKVHLEIFGKTASEA